jgi:hypothetical protein
MAADRIEATRKIDRDINGALVLERGKTEKYYKIEWETNQKLWGKSFNIVPWSQKNGRC